MRKRAHVRAHTHAYTGAHTRARARGHTHSIFILKKFIKRLYLRANGDILSLVRTEGDAMGSESDIEQDRQKPTTV